MTEQLLEALAYYQSQADTTMGTLKYKYWRLKVNEIAFELGVINKTTLEKERND